MCDPGNAAKIVDYRTNIGGCAAKFIGLRPPLGGCVCASHVECCGSGDKLGGKTMDRTSSHPFLRTNYKVVMNWGKDDSLDAKRCCMGKKCVGNSLIEVASLGSWGQL